MSKKGLLLLVLLWVYCTSNNPTSTINAWYFLYRLSTIYTFLKCLPTESCVGRMLYLYLVTSSFPCPILAVLCFPLRRLWVCLPSSQEMRPFLLWQITFSLLLNQWVWLQGVISCHSLMQHSSLRIASIQLAIMVHIKSATHDINVQSLYIHLSSYQVWAYMNIIMMT